LSKPVKQAHLFDAIVEVIGPRKDMDPGRNKTLVTQHSLKDADQGRFKILVVEDNILNQKVAVRMLEQAGYRCDVAANGKEAVEAVSRIRYDLVIMDCQMPVMDGYEATKEIRRLEGKARKTPIIAMTANAMKGDRERCLKSGMDDYMSKPVVDSVLNEILKKHLPSNGVLTDNALASDSVRTEPVRLCRIQYLADGDSDVERKLIDDFLSTSEQSLLNLEAALSAKNIKIFKNEVAKIKSACANIGTDGLQEIASRLENIDNAGDLSTAGDLLASLKSQFEHVRNYLRDYLTPK